MESEYAQAKLDFLDSLFHDFEGQNLDDYTKSHIAKYITVLCSGIFEDIFKNFILELSQKDKISDEIKEFLFKQVMRSLQNPKYPKLVDFLNGFNVDWAKKLDQAIKDVNKDALSSIVNNKNLIAHGTSSTITFPAIKQHYENCKIIIYELDKIILG